MSENLKKAILENELDESQLELVSGGSAIVTPLVKPEDKCTSETVGAKHCIQQQQRNRAREGCAATVEARSWCSSNDACYGSAVQYDGCARAEAD